MEITEDQNPGSSTPFTELQESYHPFINPHTAREQGLGQTLCRGPIQPELLHESINIWTSLPNIAIIKILVVTTTRNTWHWYGNTYSQSKPEKKNWPCQRSFMRKSNNHRENISKKNRCIPYLSPLILKIKKCNSSMQMSTGEKIKLHCGFFSNISNFFDANCGLLTLSLHRFWV